MKNLHTALISLAFFIFLLSPTNSNSNVTVSGNEKNEWKLSGTSGLTTKTVHPVSFADLGGSGSHLKFVVKKYFQSIFFFDSSVTLHHHFDESTPPTFLSGSVGWKYGLLKIEGGNHMRLTAARDDQPAELLDALLYGRISGLGLQATAMRDITDSDDEVSVSVALKKNLIGVLFDTGIVIDLNQNTDKKTFFVGDVSKKFGDIPIQLEMSIKYKCRIGITDNVWLEAKILF